MAMGWQEDARVMATAWQCDGNRTPEWKRLLARGRGILRLSRTMCVGGGGEVKTSRM